MECNKVKYSTYDFAQQDLIRIQKTSKKNTVPLSVYKCPVCSSFHLTSQNASFVEKTNKIITELKSEIERLKRITKDERKMLLKDEELTELRKINNQLKKDNQRLIHENTLLKIKK